MTAQVGRENAEPLGEALLGGPPEPPAVRLDAVEADDGRCVPLAPLVDDELHYALAPASSPVPEGR